MGCLMALELLPYSFPLFSSPYTVDFALVNTM